MLSRILFCGVCLTSVAAVGQIKTIWTAPQLQFEVVPAADGKLGSTMTLTDVREKKSQQRAQKLEKPVEVSPAGEPVPALRIRLYPQKWELQPGQALLHYTRAQILFSQNPRDKQNLWQSSEWQDGVGEGDIPATEELKLVIDGLTPVYEELHDLAMSEDFTWDHRLRDIRGPQVYMYLLPDVQEIRTMARILAMKIRYQLSQKDFDGAFSSIRDGLRLAEFVGQGETLIQRLVGIAITSIMRERITQAISTPGCPNLYWALASVPRPLIDIRDSVMWEINNITNVLPVLAESESAEWSEAEAKRKWSSALKDLEMLNGGGIIGDDDFRITLAVASIGAGEEAKQRLLKAGLPKQRLDKLPSLQLLLLDASHQLRRIGDSLGKAYLLPTELSRPLLVRENEIFQAWIRDHRQKSVAGIIAAILYPAVRQAKEAETRSMMGLNRLMTAEALRMHAATHGGSLPKSLSDLNPVPAIADPYTAKPFKYDVKAADGRQLVTLTAEGPTNFKPLQILRLSFPKATSGDDQN